jgi:hypothetical protein
MIDSELQRRHFTSLKEKYRIGQLRSIESEDFLYFILRKADSGIPITQIEIKWLTENGFSNAIEAIALKEYQTGELQRLEDDCGQLRDKYHVPETVNLPLGSPVYVVLTRVDEGHVLSSEELNILEDHQLSNTIALLSEIQAFLKLKRKYKATQFSDQIPHEPLISILKKLDAREQLSEEEQNWLLCNDFDDTLEICWRQESERKTAEEFRELKTKYQVDFHQDDDGKQLYNILKKIDSGVSLLKQDKNWLRNRKLNSLIEISDKQEREQLFDELKKRYEVTQFKGNNTSSELFKVLLKIAFYELKFSRQTSNSFSFPDSAKADITCQDIEWLRKEGFSKAAKFAEVLHFRALKSKYRIVGDLEADPFYEIMLKLENEERLDPKQVVQLIEEERLSRHGEIARAHYKLEAIFYEEEYRRTGNRWNLPSASSNWRKADDPEKAIQSTTKVNLDKVKEADLQSALLVTRGAAFRDLMQLTEAKDCAEKAKECQPESHQPYTLLGAICYDLSQYEEGDQWFEMARERGANDVDNEIERVVRMAKDKEKRREVVEYLLNKDPKRYSWARSYLK